MTTLTLEVARQRVARGAHHLDRMFPDWATRIDIGTLAGVRRVSDRRPLRRGSGLSALAGCLGGGHRGARGAAGGGDDGGAGMRLSEAIRLGAMLHPQSFKNFREISRPFQVISTCALGAASEAGYSLPQTWVRRGTTTCPVCAVHKEVHIFNTIVHLNDVHKWSREKIADWVSLVEGTAMELRAMPQDARTAVAV